MNKILYFIGLFLSSFYLFTIRTNEFLGSTILAYVLATASIFVILSFFYFYSSFYKELMLHQLKELQKKTARHWYGWFSVNFNEFTTMFLFSIPYVITIVCLLKGFTFLFPTLAILNMVAIGLMAAFCMPMIFLLLAFLMNSIQSKKQIAS